MLTLITGLPGNGKTLYALQYVHAWAKREGRQVWYHGIKGLSDELGWHVLPTKTETINGKPVEVPQWWLCPANSVFLIDEAQNCGFGVRPRGTCPEWGQKLEVHRHLGIDGVFITQDPKLIDSHDRALCELHFHLMRTFGMQRSTVHEFRPVRDNIKSRTGSIQHKWKFPKHVFKWYTSAEAHTHKARIPMKVWALGAIVLALPVAAWFVWSHYLDPNRARPGAVPVAPGAAAPVSIASRGPKLTRAEWLGQYQPRVQGLAYTAPVYDEVTKPVVAPYPAACVYSSTQCRCYSQQGTRLEVPEALCKSIADGGFFVAWQQPQPLPVAQVQDRPVQPVAAPAGGSISLSGQSAPAAASAPESEPAPLPPGRGRNLPKPAGT
jgi:hypothetical protein